MFNLTTMREIITGRRRGLGAMCVRGLLAVGTIPYAIVVRRRNRLYDKGKKEIRFVSAPVISIGNITVGGTGKTPMVAWIAKYFRRKNIRVGLVSRGYGAEQGARNDEALELEQLLPDVPHVQNPDRVEAAELAIEEFASQVLLLDDGFQHRRLARNLDIVLLDATDPFGCGWVLPRGLMREPPAGLSRARVVALSRADLISEKERTLIREKVKELAPEAGWVELAHRPKTLLSANGTEKPLDSLAGKKVAAFCGIGNPEGFRRTLEKASLDVTLWREFPDHHIYTREDIESLEATIAADKSIEAIITTHKDLVKVQADSLAERPLWALVIEIEILAGEEALTAALEPIIEQIENTPDPWA